MLTMLVDLKYIHYEIVSCRIQLWICAQSHRLFFMKNTLYNVFCLCCMLVIYTPSCSFFLSSLRQSSNENSVFLLPKSDALRPPFVFLLYFGHVSSLPACLASSLEPGDFSSPLFSGFFDICVLNWERLLFSSSSGSLFVKLEL